MDFSQFTVPDKFYEEAANFCRKDLKDKVDLISRINDFKDFVRHSVQSKGVKELIKSFVRVLCNDFAQDYLTPKEKVSLEHFFTVCLIYSEHNRRQLHYTVKQMIQEYPSFRHLARDNDSHKRLRRNIICIRIALDIGLSTKCNKCFLKNVALLYEGKLTQYSPGGGKTDPTKRRDLILLEEAKLNRSIYRTNQAPMLNDFDGNTDNETMSSADSTLNDGAVCHSSDTEDSLSGDEEEDGDESSEANSDDFEIDLMLFDYYQQQ